jgi:hypothetical protein
VQKELAGREELDVAIVSPAEPEPLERVGRELGLTVPLLSDPTWSTYRAFGFGRAGLPDASPLAAHVVGRVPSRPERAPASQADRGLRRSSAETFS